ncbi:MAG: SulP family inorganic anion transporter [Saprospiraceae bacterium]|nr:SulP family inorganic anion transporter [Saprospiraceae bacterium]
MQSKNSLFQYLKYDIPSGVVVFLVALPLCLGIAMASGAPLFSGIISGIVGGIVVGYFSKSHISVSGPAAGLTAIVLSSLSTLGTFEVFLLSVVLAGIIQIILGFINAGSISNYIPNNVIEGMLAGIGIIIILKQIPHAVGFDMDPEGDQTFYESTGGNTISSLFESLNFVHWGAILITLISIAILILWTKVTFLKGLKLLPGPLMAVISGIILNEIFIRYVPFLSLKADHLVQLPTFSSFTEFKALFIQPNFAEIMSKDVWIVAITIAAVASIESLLCIEAGDRMDVYKRYTSTNHELKAQGIGNLISGMLGGLPLTSVIVRTTANINSGARTKLSTIIHGILLFISVITIPALLNRIPLATLAAILILIGIKLANPKYLKVYWKQGKYQFLPFIITVLAVVFTDLLTGVLIGLGISILAILRGNLKTAYFYSEKSYHEGDIIHIDLAQEVSFLNKAAIKLTLAHLPDESKVVIDASNSQYIAHDVLELIREFKDTGSPNRKIEVVLKGFKEAYNIANTELTPRGTWIEHVTK